MDRRTFVKHTGASLLIWPTMPSLSGSLDQKKKQKNNKKLVFVLLRGALDPLHTVIPTQEANYQTLRPKLSQILKQKVHGLDDKFAFHPALTNLHKWYQNKQMAPIVAVNSGYDARSHFDGQDYFESGLGRIDQDNGWLARTVNESSKVGLAVSQTTPIAFRSAQQVNTWYPSSLRASDQDVFVALEKLYQDEPKLSAALTEGIETLKLVGERKKGQKDKFIELAQACGQLLSNKGGPDCAMLEMGGWDTHSAQMNRLHRKLTELDTGLGALKAALAKTWNDTVVIVATEFGRTARENGTGGTDHGLASTMFIAGGKVKGGQVLGQWPGLADEQLYENRDLKATTNAFSWIGAILSEHWQMPVEQINRVFPKNKPYPVKLMTS